MIVAALAGGVSAGCEDHPQWNGNDGSVDGHGEAGRKVTTRYEAVQEDLTGLDGHTPKFDPDYNNLVPQPWVEPATKAQSDAVSVFPDRLEFPVSMTEVLGWQEGRVVASAPGAGAGSNALGFARKVTKVEGQTSKIIVWTTTVGLEDIVQGDVQLTIKPEETVPVDLSKLDLTWVANNLYQSSDIDLSPGEPLTDDGQITLQRTGLFSWLRRAANAVVRVIEKILPETLNGSVELSGTLSKQVSDTREFELTHTFKSKKAGLSVEAALKGSVAYDALLEFRPGLQFGASIAMPGKHGHSKYWMNVDSYLRAKLDLDLNLEASVASVDGADGDDLQEKLAAATEYAQDILDSQREALFGHTDAKPVGGWRKPLLITKPSVKVFMAGPVPVVVTTTFQLDLECGFEAKASFSAHAGMEQTASLKFKLSYDTDPSAVVAQPTITDPAWDSRRRWELTATGAGEATLSCGLIPRVNVFAYDAVGLFAGVRASAVATASYESSCDDAATTWWPTAEMTLALYGNVGVQVGARVQVPGSSFAGAKASESTGLDLGPLEPWSREFKLAEKTWTFERGLGYCLPTCQNLALDDGESDVDCGGPCGSCALGKKCTMSSECAAGACNAGTCQLAFCQDGVLDRDETDIDCGGATCAACGLGKGCLKGTDCSSGFCTSSTSKTPNRCTSDHCASGVRDGDEGGVDCGGATCTKCGAGVAVTGVAHCASGLWNGTACVATMCEDRVVSGGETGIDCGGTTCAARCGLGAGCATDADCSNVAPRCDPTRKVCLRAPGGSCRAGGDCSSYLCDGTGKCTTPLCTDEVPNGDETDKDCGGTCPLKCGGGLNCKQGTDCQSGVCGVNNKCLAPSVALLQTDSTGLAFSDTVVGATSAAQSFVVTNAGQLTSSAITVEVGGTDGGDFAVQAPTGSDCVSGTTTLAGGASCTVRVAFKPTASGSRSATLAFSALAGGGGSVPLAGAGVTPAALATASTGLVFGTVAVGQVSGEQSFTLTNGGEAASSPITIAVGGANAADFEVQTGSSNDCVSGTTTLAGGASCTVRITFEPSAPGARRAAVAFSATTGGSGSVPLSGRGDGVWTATGSLTEARDLHTATPLANGKVLIVGGIGTSTQLASAREYDRTTGMWTSVGALAMARSSHTATLLANGKVLVVGGTGGEGPVRLAGAEVYDPAMGTWTGAGALATARTGHTATLLANGKVLVSGGLGAEERLASAEVYDPATGTWTWTGALQEARFEHTATLLGNGNVLVAGGYGPAGPLAGAEVYDPATGAWTFTGALKEARTEHTTALLGNGKVLAVGGLGSGGFLASAEVYDPATGAWAAAGAMSAVRVRHAAALLASGRVLVVGGFNYDQGELPSAEVYDPAGGTWSVTGAMSAGRQYHTITLLGNGKVLAVGGAGSGGLLASAELYDAGPE